jgi:hypothetical protein
MPAWIPMIRVRQISTKNWPLPPVDELPDSVWATKHTSVEVDTHDHDIVDPALLEERQQLFSIVRDGIGR